MNCRCDNVKMGSYENQILVWSPINTRNPIGIDECIYLEIRYLWFLGVRTLASCCGHNKTFGAITVHPGDKGKMILFDYKRIKDNHFQPQYLGLKNGENNERNLKI